MVRAEDHRGTHHSYGKRGADQLTLESPSLHARIKSWTRAGSLRRTSQPRFRSGD